jgi:phage gp29-like protein
MQEHARGMFIRSALLVDEMCTDDRISGVLSTRIGGLLCADLNFKPANDRRKSIKLAQFLGGSDASADDGAWLRMLDLDTAKALLKWKIMLGVAVAEIVWESDATSWLPKLVVYHPSHLWWNWGNRRFCLATNGPDPTQPIRFDKPEWMITLPRPERKEERNGHWFVWGNQSSWMQGAIRSLGMKYLDRIWNERDWARYNEKHGMALIEGKIPSGAPAEEKAHFEHDLNNLNNEPVVITPQAETGQPSYGIEFHEATSKSWETYQARKQTLDTDIAVCILGQNLTTEVSGGSLAAASIHEGIRIDKKREDADLYVQVRQQVLVPWVDYNVGKGCGQDQAPYPHPQINPPEDNESEGNALLLLGEACQALQRAYPGVDVRAILETRGIPIDDDVASALEAVKGEPEGTPLAESDIPSDIPDDGNRVSTYGNEQTAKPFALTPTAQASIITVNEIRTASGLPLWRDADGDLTVSEFQAKHGGVIADAVRAEDGEKQGDGAHLTTAFLTAISRLKASRANGPAALKRVAKYHDAVVERARRKAGSALEPLLDEIREDLTASTGPDDLKRRIVKRFKHRASPTELAKIIERVNLLGHMTGRSDILKGL